MRSSRSRTFNSLQGRAPLGLQPVQAQLHRQVLLRGRRRRASCRGSASCLLCSLLPRCLPSCLPGGLGRGQRRGRRGLPRLPGAGRAK